jgi:uncharacterized protein YbjQ (UPF0145 family)
VAPPIEHTSPHVAASSVRALTSVGFHPVGVVLGNSSMHIARPLAVRAGNRLSTSIRSFRGDEGDELPSAIRHGQAGAIAEGEDGRESPYLEPYPCPHFANQSLVPGQRFTDHFSGYNWELPLPGRALTECFNQALGRLAERAVRRDAHGVVDIRMELSGDELFQGKMEITLIGTAIAHSSAPRPENPFTAGFSCQAFAKLLVAGLVPAQFVFGAAVLSSWVGCQARRELESGYSLPVGQLGDLLTQARDVAIGRMWRGTTRRDAPFVEVTVRQAHHKSSKTDYRATAYATGTVVVQFGGVASADTAEVVVLMEQR